MEKPGASNTNINKIGPDPTVVDASVIPVGDEPTAPGGPDAITQPQYQIPGHLVEGSPRGPEHGPQPAPTLTQARVGATALHEVRPPGRMEVLAGEAAKAGKLAVNGLRIGVAKLRHGRAERKAERKDKLAEDFNTATEAALRVVDLKTQRERAVSTPKERTRMRGETAAEFSERTGNAKEDMVQGKIPKLNKVKLPQTRKGRRHQKRVAKKIEEAGYSNVEAAVLDKRHKTAAQAAESKRRGKPSKDVAIAMQAIEGEDRHARRLGRHARRAERVGGKLEKLRDQRASLKGEVRTRPQTPPRAETPRPKGPEKSFLESPEGQDSRDYGELEQILQSHGVEGAGFNAAINAKQTVAALASKDLGGKIEPKETTNGGPTKETQLKLAQRRHIAKSLGLKVGSVWVDRNKQRIHSEISVPEKDQLTPKPTWDSKLGSYVDYRGRTLSTEFAASQLSAHYLADNRERFLKPEGFQDAARSTLEQASNGAIVVERDGTDIRSRIAFERQMAQALGYEIEGVKLDPATGNAIISVKESSWMSTGETGSADTFAERLAPLGNVDVEDDSSDDEEAGVSPRMAAILQALIEEAGGKRKRRQ